MGYILSWNNWHIPRDHDCLFEVYACCLQEEMPPGMIHQEGCEDDWLLVYFHSAVRVQARGRWRDLAPGSLMVWPPRVSHDYGQVRRPWLHSWIHVSGTGVAPALAAAGFTPQRPVRVGAPGQVESWFGQIFDEISGHADPSREILFHLFGCWLHEMARSARQPAPESRTAIQRLKRYLDTHVNERISLAAMSRIVNMSASHLSAAFKQAYGISPGRYHIRQRMMHARYLLRERRRTVGEIAAALGYPDIYQFSRMFKRVTGVSPRTYQRDG